MRQATTNVQALIAFGFGLEAQDAGRHQEAAQHFARAAQLDPNFTLAAERAAGAESMARALVMTPAVLGQLGLQEFGGLRREETFRLLEEMIPDPARRDAVAEVLGTEGATRRGTVDIVITRPGGDL